MNFLNKETLIDAAALGGGVIAGRTLVKVVTKADEKGESIMSKLKLSPKTESLVANALPIAGGIATLMLFKGNRIATGVANGMFASSAAYYVDYALQQVLGEKYTSVNGIGEVFMGNVMMNGMDSSDVLMGAAQDMPDYSSSSYDFDAADAGELNY
jgi:hypothetical protein